MVMGIPCLGLDGGPMFMHTEAFSFQVATDDQAGTDRLECDHQERWSGKRLLGIGIVALR